MTSKPYLKFVILSVVIVAALAWLAVGGITETQTYYKTVAELNGMGEQAYAKRVRVAGDIAPDSIQRNGREVRFVLQQQDQTLPVIYNGIEPLPDTFRDGAQAVADGEMRADGVFMASAIQAKCASKYEAAPQFKPAERSAASQSSSL
jgi:cytochrome c-type biogenesis protein CcmE